MVSVVHVLRHWSICTCHQGGISKHYTTARENFSSPPFLAKWDSQKTSLMNAVVSVSLLRRGVTHNFCGQTEAEQEVRKKWSQHEQLCSDSGDPAPARSLLLHWQGQHTAQTPPHPDCLHCHKGRGIPPGPTCRSLSSSTGCFSGEMCFD